ncbi:MAG: HRDC domain-containing protein [Dehalococcoidia bacterium]|nr:HRDC domain-containing protein [Dehalococcoidia bacterium]
MEIVETEKDLTRLAEALHSEPRIALDTEGNSRHRYPEQLCLVQIATVNGSYIVDPIAIGSGAEPLGAVLADDRVEKIIHSADYDLRSLDREWGFQVHNIFDTSVAARIAGSRRLGLDAVLEDTLDVAIVKQKRLQQSDWSLRPLSDEALNYAIDDVNHLLELRRVQGGKLGELGRTAWALEECLRLEEIHYTPPDPPEVAFLSMKGSRELDGRGLAVLRALYVFRDGEARRRRVPPYRIVSNDALLHLSGQPEDELMKAPGIGPITANRLGGQLRAAISRGTEADPVQRPRSPRSLDPRPTKQQEDRLRALKAWRNDLGEQLDVDASLLWPMASLERLARYPEEFGNEIGRPSVIRNWQRKEFKDVLQEFLKTIA